MHYWNTFGAWTNFEMGLGKVTGGSITLTDLHEPNNKLVIT